MRYPSIKKAAFAPAAIVLCAIGLIMPAARAAEVDLYVTDYNQNPSAEQKPLIDQPLVFARPREVTVKTGDARSVTVPSPISVSVNREIKGNPREASLFAAPGEYEPFSFLLRPHETLSEVMIAPGALTGPSGAIIPAANVAVRSVEGFHGGGHDILMPLGRSWSMPANSTEHFWCTVRVPNNAKPGVYRGEVTVSSSGKPVGAIRVAIEVLPIHLSDPPFSLGFNYSKPDTDPDGSILAAHLKDMREHGMTCVAPLYNWHQPVYDSDTSELGALLEAYKKAGYPGIFYWAPPMNLQFVDLAGYGSETSRRFQQKYLKVMRLMHAEVVKHNVPAIFSIGDEFTNRGIEGVRTGERLARFVWEEMPEIAATSDMNGYSEVMAMSPYLNVAAFNIGWDGADHHNQGQRLLNKAFIEELRNKTGALPWFVNTGTGRFPYGFYFWKMSHYGVIGKVEWYYNLRNEQGSRVRTEGNAIYPTLEYERSREGIDDLKYLCALEALVAKADPSKPAAQSARALLKAIDDDISDDWTVYEERGGQRFPDDGYARLDAEKAASIGRLNAIRRQVADAIVALQGSGAK